MSDYTEPVKALREHADLIENSIELYGPSATRLLVYDLRNAAAAIEALQAEVKRLEPKRGEWIKRHEFVEDTRFDGFRCSICNWWKGDFATYNYCPRCGAKMEVQDG